MNIKRFFLVFSIVLSAIFRLKGEDMPSEKAFENFLKEFIPEVEAKEEQLNKAVWLLETTGSKDAADLLATLDNEFKLFFSDEKIYEKLIFFKNQNIQDPLLKRQLDILIKSFKANMLPKNLLKEISEKEADLFQTYANFRTILNDKKVTENELREILKKETDIELREKAWEASKNVGEALADKIVELVHLRNKAARHIGYNNFFEMKLDLDEIVMEMLFVTFDDLKNQTDDAFKKMIDEVNLKHSKEYNVSLEDLGLWAWKDPFCQADPIENPKLYEIFNDKDILDIAKKFYKQMGFDIEDLINRSDLYEREGKNQHAFCIDIDRKGDVRTLNNIKPNAQWMDTLLHEVGHAIYYLNIDTKLPWLLRSCAHTLATEALAMLMGRQIYSKEFLKEFCNIRDEDFLNEIEKSVKRKQLVFSRSVFLISEFEKRLYEDPDQDLNDLWWCLFEKYYYIKRPKNRENKKDWAAKYHIGLAPVYYHCYLLGEVFASTMQKQLLDITKENKIWKKSAAEFLTERLFFPGSKYRWDFLIEHVTNRPLAADAWVNECNN